MKINFSIHIYILIIFLLIIFGIYKLFIKVSSMQIEAHFKDIRNFSGKVPVYYKGYKIGESYNYHLSDDFSDAVVMLNIRPKNIILPKNIKAKLQKRTIFYKIQRDYIELVSPKVPTNVLLQNKDLIIGQSTIDFKDYLASQDSDSLDALKDDVSQLVKQANKVLISLDEMICDIDAIIKDLSSNIVDTSKNIEQTTGNISNLSEIISEQSCKLSSIINFSNCILSNLLELTDGLNDTLSKHFGMLRLLFAKPLG